MKFEFDQEMESDGMANNIADTVFIIRYEDDISEFTHIDDNAYKAFEIAEQVLFESGYKKKFNWNNRPFYECEESYSRYASILKMNLLG